MKLNSVFFITGGGNGIGARLAELVIDHGHRVVVADIDETAATERCRALGRRALPVLLDVRSVKGWASALDQAWARFGAVDTLVNNAGLLHTGWVRDQTPEQIEHMIAVNLLGLINGVSAVVPRFNAQKHGHVINVASLAAFVPLKGQTVYSATKHAVRAFHHGVALEHEDDPIDFTLICPGAVETGMLRKQIGQDSNAVAFSDPALSPEQVARAIYSAARTRRAEVVLPRLQGSAARLIGVLPRMLRAATRRAEKKGLEVLARRRRADTKNNGDSI
ncbi:MAG: SDR family NAD(P)-dependent oxidoreductase [Proteobacteria bacterium]|nr:SDR family NAD(P)-dependent oxidoreductase [Pseudomonadota bacterium]